MGWWWHTSYEKTEKLPTVLLQKQKYQLFLMLRQIWSTKLWLLLCIQADFVFQKSHIFIMMIFHARTKPYTSVMEKSFLIVISLCLQTGRSKCVDRILVSNVVDCWILFPSSWTGDYLTKDECHSVFVRSAERAGIQKHVSTHIVCVIVLQVISLFESGCDIKNTFRLFLDIVIQKSEIYLHVSNKTLLGIKSPFDEMWWNDYG